MKWHRRIPNDGIIFWDMAVHLATISNPLMISPFTIPPPPMGAAGKLMLRGRKVALESSCDNICSSSGDDVIELERDLERSNAL
jgi:hypothetical protein